MVASASQVVRTTQCRRFLPGLPKGKLFADLKRNRLAYENAFNGGSWIQPETDSLLLVWFSNSSERMELQQVMLFSPLR
jgi:hypothetical protein